ncbi:MAG: serine/threonine protein kinase, partial [Deltaproteobacteria bacterium]|nr:serine/threonine protein kinase [Deltaproteobacteria bacterium]
MSDKTVRENQDATVREEQNAAATRREEQASAGSGGVGVGSIFQGYRVVRQLLTKGSEADIFVIEKDAAQYILKLYRYGIKPKKDILLAIKALSESHPHEFVRLFDADFDPASERWYEIQEYVANGSLQILMADRSLLTGAQQATFFNDVAREVADALHALHQNNLLHLDLKPSNILLRSVHPLDLVLIDFGIATALDSDMSKKHTKVRGTPMYQSPESYSGVMGRPADWWGLGMILLEIAAGVHPFRGLSERVISYAIATEPVEIPENLNAGQKELLRGLLTRAPEKRWNYEQVSRWLSGERGIPQHFENFPEVNEQPSSNGTNRNPIKFMGKQYQSLADLAATFLKDEQSWKKGREFLLRGYVKQWLESNKEFDTIVDMDDAMSGTEEPDEKLFRFTQRFGENVPFAFGGHLLTLENLLIFAGKVLKRQPVTAMEQKITDSIENGALLSCLNFYEQQGRTSGIVQDLKLVLKSLKGKTQEHIVGFLDVCLHPENYYCPFLNGNTAIENIVKNVSSLPNLPITNEEQRKRERDLEQKLTGIYNGATAAMNAANSEESFKSVAETFKTIPGFRDADALAGQCLDKAEVCRKDAIYASAKSHMTGNAVTGYESAIKTFSTISGWKDADEQIYACQRKIEEIKIERERKAEEKRIADEKAAKKRKRIAAIVIPIVVACIAFLIVLNTVIIPNYKYNAAVELYNAGKYDEAIRTFTALNGYKDSSEQVTKCEAAIKDGKYNTAVALIKKGDIINAYEILIALNGYKDSTEKAKEIFGKYKIEKIKTVSVGDIVYFGSYEQDNNTSNGKEDIEWLVLSKNGNKALIISKYALDCKQYNSSFSDVTWETSTLRKWLNGTFLDAAFSTKEQSRIVSSTVTADQNPSYNTSPGNNTTDKVFLLSITEVNRYFSSDSARQCRGTAYCYARGAYKADNGNCWWWLRSPGHYSD